MDTRTSQPNWAEIAEKFDIWTPHIAPVGEALLNALQAQAGDKILELASGTGEPALTLAQRQPGAQIIGTDAAGPMVDVAKRSTQRSGAFCTGFSDRRRVGNSA